MDITTDHAAPPLGRPTLEDACERMGRRPLAVNLNETISLTRKLFELRDAARRARPRDLVDLDAAQPDRD